jgi:pilus assembly protein TadC
MNTYYDRFLAAYIWQNNITLLVFFGAGAVMLVTWLFSRNLFMRKWILPVWVGYLILLYAMSLLFGVYGR